MQKNPVVMLTFSDFHRKYHFSVNLFQKSKLSVYFEIWYLHEFEYAELNGDVKFFYFLLELLFLGKFGPTNQNCPFKLKFG